MGTIQLEEGAADHVSISIIDKFDNLSNPSSECCIFRMYDHLRKENEKAYEPLIVAIGPYHHGKPNLQEMELHKLRYLQGFLSRRNESVNRYVMAIRELEGRARKCYAETYSSGLDLDSDQFVEMMLLDGFFIIELFCKFMTGEFMDENDHIFQSWSILFAIGRDLILLENQLPFFIIDRLFHMTNSDSNLEIIPVALEFLKISAPNREMEAHSEISIDNIKHLLDLVHDCWCFEFAQMDRDVKKSHCGISIDNLRHLLDLVHDCWCFEFAQTDKNAKEWKFMDSATELQESGVQFKKAKGSNLFDIKFISGTLEIPQLCIEEKTESFLTNLVAFELCSSYLKRPYVCEYIVFMNSLINSSKDVRLLRRGGIIESWVGDDEHLYTMCHNLFKITLTNPEKFGYSQIFNDVDYYCKRRRNEWMANLRRNYFNSPWAFISFLAAAILLLLTVAQTIFSVLSFRKGSF